MAHKEQRNFCERVKGRFPDDFNEKKVLDVGSLDVNGNNRYLFDGCDYTGIDLGPGNNVDIVCPAHELEGLYDTIISTEAFEHDRYIKDSLKNIISNLLRPGGLFLFTCAGEGRAEHGTINCSPKDAPFTNDYYQNLSKQFIRKIIDIEFFFGKDFKFFLNSKTKDLYFVGRRISAEKISSAPFWEELKVSIVIPVIRPKKIPEQIATIKRHTGITEDQYEILTEEDIDHIGAPKMVAKLTKRAKYDLVLFLGDDTLPEAGFLKAAIEKMETFPDGWGVVGLNTQDIRKGKAGNPSAHWMAHKKMLEYLPDKSFFSTEYNHGFCDVELKDIAEELDRWVFAEESRIEHVHPINRTAEYDKGYQRVYSEENTSHDQKTYFTRKRKRMEGKYGTKLAVALPLTAKFVSNEFFFSSMRVITTYMASNTCKSFDVLAPDFPGNIDAVRNSLVLKALNIGATHLLFMDTDQIYETPDMIETLLAHKKPVVGTKVHRRYPPFDPLLFRGEIGKLLNVPDEEIQNADGSFAKELSVDFVGTGCILIDTQIFINMFPEKPFELRTDERGKPIGEDIGFCDKLKKKKIPIIADCNIEIPHLTFMAAGWAEHKIFDKIHRRRKES